MSVPATLTPKRDTDMFNDLLLPVIGDYSVLTVPAAGEKNHSFSPGLDWGTHSVCITLITSTWLMSHLFYVQGGKKKKNLPAARTN